MNVNTPNDIGGALATLDRKVTQALLRGTSAGGGASIADGSVTLPKLGADVLAELATFALDTGVVHKSGTETVTGAKTFTATATEQPTSDSDDASWLYDYEATIANAPTGNQGSGFTALVNLTLTDYEVGHIPDFAPWQAGSYSGSNRVSGGPRALFQAEGDETVSATTQGCYFGLGFQDIRGFSHDASKAGALMSGALSFTAANQWLVRGGQHVTWRPHPDASPAFSVNFSSNPLFMAIADGSFFDGTGYGFIGYDDSPFLLAQSGTTAATLLDSYTGYHKSDTAIGTSGHVTLNYQFAFRSDTLTAGTTNRFLHYGDDFTAPLFSVGVDGTIDNTVTSALGLITALTNIGAAPTIRFRRQKTGGTALASGDAIGTLRMDGHDGSDYATAGSWSTFASQTWTTSHHGSELRVNTVPNNATVPARTATFGNDGYFYVGAGAGGATAQVTPSSLNIFAADTDTAATGAIFAAGGLNGIAFGLGGSTAVDTSLLRTRAAVWLVSDSLALGSGGSTVLTGASVATAAVLAACTYANGSSGVGATLTANANGALTVDGVSVATIGTRVLVRSQAATLQNGIYRLSQIGDGSHPWILTRASGADSTTDFAAGIWVWVASGTTWGRSVFRLTTTTSITVGTNGIAFAQIAGLPDSSFVLIGGSSGGQSVYGGTATGDRLTLNSNTLNDNYVVSADGFIASGGVFGAIGSSGTLTLRGSTSPTVGSANVLIDDPVLLRVSGTTTFTSAPDATISLPSNRTLAANYAANLAPKTLDVAAVFTLAQAGTSLAVQHVHLHPTVTFSDDAASSSTGTSVRSFVDTSTVQIDTATGKTLGIYYSFRAAPTVARANSGTFTTGAWRGVGSGGATISAGVTLDTTAALYALTNLVNGSVAVQYGLYVEALAGATVNVGVYNLSSTVAAGGLYGSATSGGNLTLDGTTAVSLANAANVPGSVFVLGADVTYTTSTPAALFGTSSARTVTGNNSSGAVLPIFVQHAAAATLAAAGGTRTLTSFESKVTLSSAFAFSSSTVIASATAFRDANTMQATAVGLAMGLYASFYANPTFTRTSTNTITSGQFYGLWTNPTVAAGVTLGVLQHVRITDVSNAGTVTTQYGVDVGNGTALSGATTNIGIRNASTLRQMAATTFGADAAARSGVIVDVQTGALAFSNQTGTTLTYASTISLDPTLSNVFKTTTVNATGNATINLATAPPFGQVLYVIITNDATSGKTITFGTSFKPNATLVGTVSKSAVVTFVSDGTNAYEVSRQTVL